MPKRDRFLLAPRLLPFAVALLMVAAPPAAAQEPTPLQRLLGKMGLLEIPDEEGAIDYRERAPLVVPPSSALVAPRSSEDIAKYNPDWPRDHDARKRSPAAKEFEKQVDEEFYSGRPLTPNELNRPGRLTRAEAARRDAAARRPEAQTAGDEYAAGKERYTPSQLGFKGWGSRTEEKVVFTGEPERKYLTDPPPGLLTPSPNAPYGVVSKDRGPAKPLSFFDRTSAADDHNARK
jgi:hypothetical protein